MDTQMSLVSRLLDLTGTGVAFLAIILVGGLCVAHCGAMAVEPAKADGVKPAVGADVRPPVGSVAASSRGVAPPVVMPVRTLSGHTDTVRSVAFSPDGKTLASGGFDGTLRLWSLPEGKERAKIEFHPRAAWDRITAVAFSPDGKLIATSSSDGRVRLWDPASGKELRRMQGPTGWALCVAFSRDGKWVAAGGSGNTVKLWEAESGKPVHGGLIGNAGVQGIAIGADGESLVMVGDDYGVTIFRLNPPQRLATVPLWTQPLSVACERNDQALAVGLDFAGSIVLFKRDAGGEVQRYILGGHERGTNSLAFSPDGKVLASVGNDGKLKLWDVSSPRMLAEATADPVAAFGVAFSPDGGHLASAGIDRKVRLWNVDQLKAMPHEGPSFANIREPLRQTRIPHPEEVRSVGELKRLGAAFLAEGARPSWSPDGTRVVYLGHLPESDLNILDLRTGQSRSLGEMGRDPAWSPKPGRWIAYTSGRQVAEYMGSRPAGEPFTDPPQGNEQIRLIDTLGGLGDRSRKIADGFAPA